MLGKLFGYEFRATGRTFLPMYAVLLVMSFAASLLYSGDLSGRSEQTVSVIVTLVMVMLFTAVWVITLAVVIRRFWTNVLGREGYLMNVLPVSPWEHVFSKAVTSMVWVVLSAIASVLALFIMLGGVLPMAFYMTWQSLAREWAELWTRLRDWGADGQAVLMIVEFVLNALFGVICFILTAYAAMCVGQLADKHRVWASVGAYFGVSIIHSVLGTTLLNGRPGGPLSLIMISAGGDGPYVYWRNGAPDTLNDVLAHVNTELLVYLIFTLAVSAVLFFLSQWLLKKHLNLQ